MTPPTDFPDGSGNADLAKKIAKLVEERGWNQEVFAKACRLNRHTVRQILHPGPQRRLRNATVRSCAEALGLTVHELRTLPLDRLLSRMHGYRAVADAEVRRQLSEAVSLPEFIAWIERNPDRVDDFQLDEVGELVAEQLPGGSMERLGVEQCVTAIERRRELIRRVKELAKTEYVTLLEQLVELIQNKLNTSRQPPPLGRHPRGG